MDTDPSPLNSTSLSLIGALQHADIVVQAVVAGLLLCSVACWAIIFDKIVRVRRLRRSVVGVESYASDSASGDTAGLVAQLLSSARDELADEHTSDARYRVEVAMRAVCLKELQLQERGLPFLATLASSAPFVGLFGTVWGIMHSFASIAAAKDTSLAAVAPGIAEALLATAVGLFAAIPAVIGYNQSRAAFARCGQRLAAATASIARMIAKSHAAASVQRR